MSILLLVRNFVPAHEQIIAGDWNVAAIAKDAYDLEGKVIGTLGAGRIGYRVLQRLLPFDPKELLYCTFSLSSSTKETRADDCEQTDDYQSLPAEAEAAVKARRVEDLKEFLGQLDVLTVNCPLHESTKGIIKCVPPRFPLAQH